MTATVAANIVATTHLFADVTIPIPAVVPIVVSASLPFKSVLRNKVTGVYRLG
jgi:hypothetical protein